MTGLPCLKNGSTSDYAFGMEGGEKCLCAESRWCLEDEWAYLPGKWKVFFQEISIPDFPEMIYCHVWCSYVIVYDSSHKVLVWNLC
jgi:hypothetical protein